MVCMMNMSPSNVSDMDETALLRDFITHLLLSLRFISDIFQVMALPKIFFKFMENLKMLCFLDILHSVICVTTGID